MPALHFAEREPAGLLPPPGHTPAVQERSERRRRLSGPTTRPPAVTQLWAQLGGAQPAPPPRSCSRHPSRRAGPPPARQLGRYEQPAHVRARAPAGLWRRKAGRYRCAGRGEPHLAARRRQGGAGADSGARARRQAAAPRRRRRGAGHRGAARGAGEGCGRLGRAWGLRHEFLGPSRCFAAPACAPAAAGCRDLPTAPCPVHHSCRPICAPVQPAEAPRGRKGRGKKAEQPQQPEEQAPEPAAEPEPAASADEPAAKPAGRRARKQPQKQEAKEEQPGGTGRKFWAGLHTACERGQGPNATHLPHLVSSPPCRG